MQSSVFTIHIIVMTNRLLKLTVFPHEYLLDGLLLVAEPQLLQWTFDGFKCCRRGVWVQTNCLKAIFNLTRRQLLIHSETWYEINCFQCLKKSTYGFHEILGSQLQPGDTNSLASVVSIQDYSWNFSVDTFEMKQTLVRTISALLLVFSSCSIRLYNTEPC